MWFKLQYSCRVVCYETGTEQTIVFYFISLSLLCHMGKGPRHSSIRSFKSNEALFHSQVQTLVASLLQFSLLLVHVSVISSMYHLNISNIKPLTTMITHHISTYQCYCSSYWQYLHLHLYVQHRFEYSTTCQPSHTGVKLV